MALALIENLQREDLNPMENARAIARLVEEFSLTHQEIASLLSKSRAAISNFLRLLSLSSEVMELLEKNKLDMGHARALLPLEKDKQIAVAEQIVAKDLSVRETENWVKKLKDPSFSNSPKIIEDMPSFPFSIEKKMQTLATHLQTKISFKQDKAGKGMLLIHYESLQSLEELLSQLTL